MDARNQVSAVASALAGAMRSFQYSQLPALHSQALSIAGDGQDDTAERLDVLQSIAADALSHRWSEAHLRLLDHLAASCHTSAVH